MFVGLELVMVLFLADGVMYPGGSELRRVMPW